MHNLPPLTALRAFEATARLLSFTAAAEELHVTQSAISRQVRLLEAHLQHQLFLRLTRRIELTPQGTAYYEEIRQAFDRIGAAGDRLRGQRRRAVLTVAVLPGLASLWLMPRLEMFWHRHRDIEVRIVVAVEPVDFRRGQVDMAIQVGSLPGAHDHGLPLRNRMVADWTGVRADALFDDALVVLGHPRQLRQHPVKAIGDLARHRLIHAAVRPQAWADWLAAGGHRLDAVQPAMECSQYSMALQAAMRAEGIALVPSVLADSFDPGHALKRLLGPPMPSAGRYYVLAPASRDEDKPVRLFRAWLLEQAAQA